MLKQAYKSFKFVFISILMISFILIVSNKCYAFDSITEAPLEQSLITANNTITMDHETVIYFIRHSNQQAYVSEVSPCGWGYINFKATPDPAQSLSGAGLIKFKVGDTVLYEYTVNFKDPQHNGTDLNYTTDLITFPVLDILPRSREVTITITTTCPTPMVVTEYMGYVKYRPNIKATFMDKDHANIENFANEARIAAQEAKIAAINTEVLTNYIKNNILSVDAGIVRDNTGTVMQVARDTLTATNTVNTTLGTVNTNVNTVKTDVSGVKTDVGSVKTTVGTVNTTVGTINTNVNTANSTLGTVNTSVNTVKTDVGTVKTTVGTVNTTVGTINTNVNTANTTLGTVNTSVNTVKTDVGTVKTDVGTVKNNVWDSAEGKSAATLAKEARDKINTVQSMMAPTISKVEGLNGATCTKGTAFTVLIYASGADQYCARLVGGSWSAWGASNSISVSIGSNIGPKIIEVKARNSANAASEACSSINIFKL